MPETYILLEDVIAQKQTSNKWNPLTPKSFVGERLLRGSLLVELTDGEAKETQQHFTPPLNYKKYSDDSVKLYCKPEQVFQLSDEQFSLLLGVKLPFDRYKVLNILRWVEKLRIGYGVNVTIPYPVRGIIRYIGPLPGEEGTKFGIELLEKRGQGTSDGTFKNTEYFKCARDCAIFVAMDKLSEPEISKSSQVHETVQPHLSQIQNAPLKLGDIVKFYDDSDRPVNGIVRWIGRNRDVLRSGSRIVGIETDQKVLPALIPGSLVRLNHLFTLHNSKGVQVFLPIDSVLKIDDNDPPNTTNVPGHPYNIRSKDKHNVANDNPEATMYLIQKYRKKEGQSEGEFMLEQRRHREEIELKKQQEEAAKVKEKQSNALGKDFDVHKIDIDEQKRLYEEAQRASKQGGEEQKSSMDTNSGGMNNSQQHGGRHHQPRGNQQDSSVDPTGHGYHAGQKQFYGSLAPQHQYQQPGYLQGSNVVSTGYGQNIGQQQFYGTQVLQHHQTGYQGPNVDPTGYGCVVDQHHQHYPTSNPYNLKVGSLILYGNPSHSGKIKWIGHLPEVNASVAGVEMDDYVEGTTRSNGVWKGIKYFEAQPGRGCFVPLTDLRLDTRFGDGSNSAVMHPIVPSSGGEANLPEVTQLRKDLKTLEAQIEQLGGDHDSVNSTVTQLHGNVSEIEKKFENLQTQIGYYQQKTEDSIQRMVANVDNAFQKALEVQKNYEELQKSNAHLINQLSLTQQQLLGVQAMMTGSRLWVVSHDQFTIGREIGRGAWGTVHETTFRGATVAAKRLHQLITAPRTRQLFQREMEMALQCQHQNIVTFLGATLEDPPVILMELMDTSLRSAYEQENIKHHQVLGIFYDIAGALHFLHTRPDPVIHRDVSSANVLLKALYNGEWLAKLGDLGTAKLQRLTTTAGPGAIIYGAPEASDAAKHSPKMDVYSIGVLVLETLTSTLPIENLDALKDQVRKQFPWYHQLVTSCTNHQSSDRPTMYDVIGQLDKIKKIAKP